MTKCRKVKETKQTAYKWTKESSHTHEHEIVNV